MGKIYIETSSINQAREEKRAGSEISHKLESLGFEPVIGMHTIYELAKTYLVQGGENVAKDLFIILKDIKPIYFVETSNLLEQEIIKLRTGSAVVPYLDYFKVIATKYEIEKLSSGNFDKKAEAFIKSREEHYRNREKLIVRASLNQIKEQKSWDSNFRTLRTFQEVEAYFFNQIPRKIQEILWHSVTLSEAQELSKRLDSFPALRSNIKANLYLSFILIVHNARPSFDKPDDYRHIIAASYSDSMLVTDTQLSKTVNRINPNLQVLIWKNIFV
ncbi:hypothetical protein KAX35_08570 [candidate division WOR-3 bacterium]|nr:hypothetical protein [candidate division WOR-3 bacterium]